MTHGMRTERIIRFARNGTLVLLLIEQQGHIQRGGSVSPPETYKSLEEGKVRSSFASRKITFIHGDPPRKKFRGTSLPGTDRRVQLFWTRDPDPIGSESTRRALMPGSRTATILEKVLCVRLTTEGEHF